MLRLLVSLCVFSTPALFAQGLRQSFMPENDLHLQNSMSDEGSNITQEVFDSLIDNSQNYFAPYVKNLGGTLTIEKLWDNEKVNANAQKYGSGEESIWIVRMFGGLARRPEVTPDGFQMVICHEIGHHLAGYSFVIKPFVANTNMANEGQSDYFSSQACSRALWKDQVEANKKALSDASENIVTLCNAVWSSNNDRGMCARSIAGGKSLSALLAELGEESTPQVETPSTEKVSTTYNKHPKAQCRLDTYIAAALCTKTFSLSIIPGLNSSNVAENTAESEMASNKFVCNSKDKDNSKSVRPSCWFASLVTEGIDDELVRP